MAEDFNKKVTLIEVEVDNKSAIASVDKLTDSILDQKDAIKDNTTEVKDLEKANKDLGDQVKKGSITQDEAAKKTELNKGKIKELNKANENLKDDLKDLNKERNQEVKVSKLQANSLDALRGKVAAQKKELNGLNTATEKGRKRFDELTKELKKNNEAIKDADQSAGDYKTSIGDYAGQLGIVQKATLIQTQAQGFLNAVVNTGTKTTSFASKALKIFKIALASTGVGLLVLALGSLVSFLTTTQEGMDKVTAVTRPLAAIFEKIKGVVQDLGGNVFAGLAQIMNGDIREGLKTLGGGFKQAFSDVQTAVSEGIIAGTKLDKLTKQIEKSEIALTTQRAELNRTFAESQEIAKDITKTEEERVAAAQAAIKAQNDLLSAEQNFLNLKIERLELDQTLNDTSREGELELAGLIAERTAFEETAAKKRAGANAQLNSINKQIAGQEIARIKERQAEEDNAALQEEKRQAKKLNDQRALNEKLEELDTFRREQENESALAAAETEEERFQLLLEQQDERFEIEQEKLAEQEELALENKELSDEEKLIVEADFQLQKEELIAESENIITSIEADADALRAANKDKADKKALDKERKKRKSLRQIINTGLNVIQSVADAAFSVRSNRITAQNEQETKVLQNKLASGQITREKFDALKEALDKSSARKAHALQVRQFRANKALSILEIAISTALAIAKALRNPPGPPFSIPQAVAAGIIGGAQLATVISSRPPSASFAQGGDVFGFVSKGKSHAMGGETWRNDSGGSFNIEGDEGVFITKREATNPALSLLSSVNKSFGGRSMFSAPKQFLQEGGAASASQGLNGDQLTELVEATAAALPPLEVKVTDIMAGIQGNVEAKETGVI